MSFDHSRSVVSDAFPRARGYIRERRLDTEGKCNFYRNRCRILEEHLSFAEEILIKDPLPDDVSEETADLSWPRSVLTELRRSAKVGDILIKGCYGEACHKAYMRQGERTEAFVEALKDILWCMSVVFYYNSKECLPGNFSIDEFPLARLGAKEQFLLQKASLADQKELLTALELWMQNHRHSAEECGAITDSDRQCLANQILERRSLNDGGTRRDLADDHTSVLWIASQEVLKDGTFLGSGGFGTVLITTWLDDLYAKKVFKTASDVGKTFEMEVNALAKLNHPHIVKVSAYYASKKTCFFLMESMPHDLRTHMENRMELNQGGPPFAMRAGIDLVLQISEAMSYIHSKKMVHRDLKPENILVKPLDDPELCKEGFVVAKLVDFGLAKIKHDVTAFSHVTKNTGTRRWMAPEVWGVNADDADHLLVALPKKADVYSFGIVCSEVLTGEAPFQNVFSMKELYKLLTDSDNPLRPELPGDCPEILASLICECWHPDPMRRPSFIEISTTLRHLKGFFMVTGDETILQEKWARRVKIRAEEAQVQGPWGGDGGGYFFDSIATSIKRIKIKHDATPNMALCLFEVEYNIDGRDFIACHGDSSYPHGEDNEIIMGKGEFLTQIEGSFSRTGVVRRTGNTIGQGVVSLTLHTNLASYGPYGVKGETSFKSDIGRIVGFFGRCGTRLDQIGVIIYS